MGILDTFPGYKPVTAGTSSSKKDETATDVQWWVWLLIALFIVGGVVSAYLAKN